MSLSGMTGLEGWMILTRCITCSVFSWADYLSKSISNSKSLGLCDVGSGESKSQEERRNSRKQEKNYVNRNGFSRFVWIFKIDAGIWEFSILQESKCSKNCSCAQKQITQSDHLKSQVFVFIGVKSPEGAQLWWSSGKCK